MLDPMSARCNCIADHSTAPTYTLSGWVTGCQRPEASAGCDSDTTDVRALLLVLDFAELIFHRLWTSAMLVFRRIRLLRESLERKRLADIATGFGVPLPGCRESEAVSAQCVPAELPDFSLLKLYTG